MLYSGGVLLTTQSVATVQTYQNASISQQYITPRWVFGATDSVSYLPQSPTTGYSGIAGAGDAGSINGPSQGPAGGILTNYGNRVSNALGVTIERRLTAATSITGSSSWDILRFIDNTGLDTTGISGTVGLNHRLSGRTTINANAVYSIFYYGSYGSGVNVPNNPLNLSGLSYQTRGLNLGFQRLMTHSVTISVSAGPQLINSSNALLSPPVTTAFVSAAVTYTHRLTSASISYFHGGSGGSGVQQGSLADSVTGAVSHTYSRDWQGSVSGGYTHSSALIQSQAVNNLLGINGTYNSFFGGVQATRRLGEHSSLYMSYTAIAQSSNSSPVPSSPNVYSGVGSIFSIGYTWAPRSTSLGQLF